MADEVLTKASELADKSDSELETLLQSTRSALFTARFENHTNKLNDTSRLGKLRRQAARIHTMLKSRKTKAKSEGKSHG